MAMIVTARMSMMVMIAATAVVPSVVIGAEVIAMAESGYSSGEEEDNIHDGKGPTGLEHHARLVLRPSEVGDREAG